MPLFLLPIKGRYGLRDYEKMFCPDLKGAHDIFVNALTHQISRHFDGYSGLVDNTKIADATEGLIETLRVQPSQSRAWQRLRPDHFRQ